MVDCLASFGPIPLGAIQENEFRRYLANATTLKVKNADVPFCSAIKVKVST